MSAVIKDHQSENDESACHMLALTDYLQQLKSINIIENDNNLRLIMTITVPIWAIPGIVRDIESLITIIQKMPTYQYSCLPTWYLPTFVFASQNKGIKPPTANVSLGRCMITSPTGQPKMPRNGISQPTASSPFHPRTFYVFPHASYSQFEDVHSSVSQPDKEELVLLWANVT